MDNSNNTLLQNLTECPQRAILILESNMFVDTDTLKDLDYSSFIIHFQTNLGFDFLDGPHIPYGGGTRSEFSQ